MYRPINKTNRIAELMKKYSALPVPVETNAYLNKKYRTFRTGDRWVTLGFLRGWQKYATVQTSKLRMSYAEAEELYEAQPVFVGDELLAGHLYLPEYSPEEQEEYEKLCDMFQMSNLTLMEMPPRKDHLALDFDKLIKLGISGIIEEIEKEESKLNLSDSDVYPEYEVLKKYEFYQCLKIELEACIDLAKRYSQKAKELAEKAEEPRKSELLKISNVMSVVPEKPATTFYEAIQSVHFFLSNLFGLYPLGRPDRYLYPFYEQDIKNGTLTKELAQELIDNFCLGISDRVFSRAACGFIVGGEDENGNNVENDLTYMFITALEHLHLPDPNGALAVNDKTSDELLKYCTDVISKGVTHPAFYNDKAIINSLVENYGCKKEDAVNYIHSTCAEITIIGKSKGHTTCKIFDLPRYLMNCAKENSGCVNFDEFYNSFITYLKKETKCCLFDYTMRMMESSRNGNEPLRVNALISDCIARGKSIYEGGERYTFIQPVYIGFSTTVDSLYAIKNLVYDNKKLTLSEFSEICENNFEGNERLRQYIINKLPHYGNDEECVDMLSAMLGKDIQNLHKEDVLAGKQIMPGTFSYISHAMFGERMGATFDGRKKGHSYSDGCSPVQGRDTEGPTAMINSLTSWEQSALLGGMVVNIKFGENHLKGENAMKFTELLRVFIKKGGLEMQVNVVDRETLLDARKNPENHRDLLVRIGGYSDYFTRLSPTLQEEIIERTEY